MFDPPDLSETDVSWSRGATHDELCDRALELERWRKELDAAQSAVLGELDVRGTTDVAFGLRTGAWLAREASLPTAVAKQRVAVG